MEIASGWRAARGPKNSQPNWSFCTKVFIAVVGGFQQECGWVSKTGQPETRFQQAEEEHRHSDRAISRKHRNFRPDNGGTVYLVGFRFRFRRLITFKTCFMVTAGRDSVEHSFARRGRCGASQFLVGGKPGCFQFKNSFQKPRLPPKGDKNKRQRCEPLPL